MATRRFTVDEALEAVFDDDFGLSDGESSEEEEGDDLYALLGDPIVRRSDIDALTRDLVDGDGDGDSDGDNDGGDRASDGSGDVLSLADPEDPFVSMMMDEDVGSSPSSSMLGASDSFAATSRGDDEGEISDEAPMDFDESPELSEGESEDNGSGSDDNGRKSDDSSKSGSSGDGYRTTGRGRVRARGRGASSSVRARGRGAARGRGTTPRTRGRGRARGRGGVRGAGGRGRGATSMRGTGCGAGLSSGGIDMINWKKDESNALNYNYNKTPGPTTTASSNVTPLELFSRFFTDEVWDLLVQETNRYASENVSHTPHARPWEDVTVPEMKAFTGILILMGIVKLPRLDMYWQVKHPLIATEGMSSIMSRIRFEQIYRFLHLADSSQQVPAGQPGHDKLFKVRNLLNLVLPKFESEYVMHESVTIDEAMIPFKGRLGFKQYIKNKPTKWGIKAFVLSDATNGYIYRMQIYTGKNADSDSSVGLCSRVVLDLMSGLEREGFDLYTDNYYTSPILYKSLYEKGINACGTMRPNRRGFPPELVHKRKDEARGFYDYRSNGPLLAAVWFDRRFIYFLSTMHSAESSTPVTVKRTNQDGSRNDVPCPPLLPDYQQYMRGVDRGDQLIGCYNVGRRSKKWWKRVFAHTLECSILNAYILERHAKPLQHALRGRNKRDFLRFRLELAEQLIGTFRSRKRAGRRRSTESDRLKPQLGHLPIQVANKLECVVCNTRRAKLKLTRSQLRHETRFKCTHCNVHLCIDQNRQCFQKYHTLVCYWS